MEQRRFGDARCIGNVVAAAEHAINPALRRKKPAPPGEIQILKALNRENAQVDFRSVSEADSDELSKKGIQVRAAFKHGFVERRALFARDAAEGDEKRAILIA